MFDVVGVCHSSHYGHYTHTASLRSSIELVFFVSKFFAMENQHTRSVRSNRSNRFQRNRKPNGTDKPRNSETSKNVEKSYDLGPCPWDDQQVKVVTGVETCRAVVTELRK